MLYEVITPLTAAAALRAAPRFAVRNPYTGALIAELPEADDAEVLATVARAKTAADAFRASTPHQRRALLNALAELLTRDVV